VKICTSESPARPKDALVIGLRAPSGAAAAAPIDHMAGTKPAMSNPEMSKYLRMVDHLAKTEPLWQFV
jgi:hypothetical protein